MPFDDKEKSSDETDETDVGRDRRNEGKSVKSVKSDDFQEFVSFVSFDDKNKKPCYPHGRQDWPKVKFAFGIEITSSQSVKIVQWL